MSSEKPGPKSSRLPSAVSRAKPDDPTVATAARRSDLADHIGARVRQLRNERQLSGRTLATAIGVSSGFISQVERGQVLPSVANLVALAEYLDVGVGDLVETPLPNRRVMRKHERVQRHYPAKRMTRELLAADPAGRLDVVRIVVEPGGGTESSESTYGSKAETVLVLRGQLEVTVDDESITLKEGDSLSFSRVTSHEFSNTGRRASELVWVTTPASYLDANHE